MAVFDRRLILHFYWTMFSLALGLCLVGLISVLSATHGGAGRVLNPLVLRQFIWIGEGTALVIAVAHLDYRALGAFAYPPYGGAVALLAFVSVAGQVTGG